VDYAKLKKAELIGKVEELQDEINKLKKELAQAERESTTLSKEEKFNELERLKTEFIDIVTHELRTPITPLKSAVELFLDGSLGMVTPKQKMFLEMMARNIDRLALFATEVVTLSRLEAGSYMFQREKVNMRDIAASVARQLEKEAENKKATINIDVAPGLHAVADAQALSQVFTNLVHNAIVHNPEGTEVVINTREQNGDFVEVAVSDNGRGVPAEALKNLFTRFYQFDRKPGPGYRGTGIGLAVSKKLVEAMGGEIIAESTCGKGSTFKFTLPASIS